MSQAPPCAPPQPFHAVQLTHHGLNGNPYLPTSMTRFNQLDKQIARLRRRESVLNKISRKYWNARRIIFVSGALLALAFCNFAGSTMAWLVATLIALLFLVVSIFHNRVRDSLTANSLLLEIKQVQIARIQSGLGPNPTRRSGDASRRDIRLKAISISPVSVRCTACSIVPLRKKAANG